jgi:general secretion pathway protein D
MAGAAPSSDYLKGATGDDQAGAQGVEVDAGGFQAKITSDETNNAVIVYATPRDYSIVEDALRKLDIPPYQVMIEAAITEVTLTDALRFGVQGLYKVSGTSIGLTESATAAAPVQDFPGFSALYAGKTISAALNALEGMTTVKVISAPKLMVLNNQTASIEVGDEVPILTGSATSTLTSSAPIVNSVDYRDTGIILHVTPRVNSSGVVLLDMAQEVSAVVQSTTTTSSSTSINSPTISTRKIATSVAVQDGEVIALGGLISDNRDDTSSGLPVLSRIPVLGPLLFGNINNNDTRTELVVLLKPTVIRNVDDGRAITDELRDKLQGLRDLLPQGGVP